MSPMKAGWWVVLAGGMAAAFVRAVGAAPVADAAAIGYLLLATVTFGRWNSLPAAHQQSIRRGIRT
jgi:hypothetical protein